MILSALAQIGIYLVVRTLLLGGAALAWTRWSGRARTHRIYRLEIPAGQLRSEGISAVMNLAVDSVLAVLFVDIGLIHVSPTPTAATTVASFGLLFVFMEVYFYFTHRAFHWKPLYFIHRQHHVAHVTEPLTSMSFGLIERIILNVGPMGFAALVSRSMPYSVAGLSAYFLVNFVLNLLAHLNVEIFPSGYPNSVLARLLNSSSYHAMHHARFQGHFGLFTPVCDRLFDTRWPDYTEVHARATQGRGLEKLGEIAAVGSPPTIYAERSDA